MLLSDTVSYFNILINNPNSKGFTSTEYKPLFDVAQDEIEVMIRNADQDHLLTTTGTISTSTNKETYPLPANFVYMKRVEKNTSPYQELTPIDYEERRDFSGNNEYYYITGVRSVTGSASTSVMLGIISTPTSVSTSAIRYDYVKSLPDFADTWTLTNVLPIPDPGYMLLAEKAAKIYLTANGKDTSLVDDLIARHEVAFIKTITQRQKQEAESIGINYADY